jgi:hypothetical protein
MPINIQPDQIEQLDDPVALLASQCLEVLMDHPDFIGACNRLVFRSMGLHPKTMIGGDETDRRDFYHMQMDEEDLTLADVVNMTPEEKKDIFPDFITEDDPRYQLYWELLAQLNSQIFAQMVASQKFRWGKDFAERTPTGLTSQPVMGESNR